MSQDLGHYAASNNLTTVEFMDTTQGFPGTLVSNPFNPDGTDLKSRYGIDPGVNYQYIVGQYVGAHTRDRDHIAAPLLYKEALGLDSAGPWDIFDMNLVKGLTAKIIEEMNKKGLKTMDEQGVVTGSAVTGSASQTNPSAPTSLDLSAMLTSTLAALLPALIQAEIARALPKGVLAPQVPSQPVQQPIQAPVQAPSLSVAAVLSPLAAQAQSALNDLQHQVGEGGGHWAQGLRALANAVVSTKQRYV
jgi:hypothetical protein